MTGQPPFPDEEASDAQYDGNPRGSIHKIGRGRYSQASDSVASRIQICFGSGTGSCPQPPQGWQRASRFNPSQPPRRKRCVSTASKKYREQVGSNRQPEPGPLMAETAGEIVR